MEGTDAELDREVVDRLHDRDEYQSKDLCA
jgi:hypothetical protein